MGAITFSIDPRLVEALVAEVSFDVFVETGTYRGDSVQQVRHLFKEVLSIESSESYFNAAFSRFEDDDSVTIQHGDSAEVLAELQDRLRPQRVLYWLDAHWCADEHTAGASSQCPLLRELKAIGKLNRNSVVLIDDARLFLAPPSGLHDHLQWPMLHEILQGLRRLSKRHLLMVVNDVVVYFPPRLERALRYFAHEQGVDWLSIAHRSREHDLLIREIEAKEAVITEVHEAAEERLERIRQFEREIAGAGNQSPVMPTDLTVANLTSQLGVVEELKASFKSELTRVGDWLESHTLETEQLRTGLRNRESEMAEIASKLSQLCQSQTLAFAELTSEVAEQGRELGQLRPNLAAELERLWGEVAKQRREADQLQAVVKRCGDELAKGQERICRAFEAKFDRGAPGEPKRLKEVGESPRLRQDEALSELVEKEKVISALRGELDARDEVISEHVAGIEAMRQALENMAPRVASLEALEKELEDREGVIATLKAAVDTRSDEELRAESEAKLEVIRRIAQYRSSSPRYWLEYCLDRLGLMELPVLDAQSNEVEPCSTRHVLESDLFAKERSIRKLEAFRKTSFEYWAVFLLGKVGLGGLARFREWFRPRIGVLWHHEPIAMRSYSPEEITAAHAEALPTISMVTPAFNQADFLERTVRSVLDQRYPRLEYIVQDAASTDGSVEILERLAPELARVVSEPDSGQADGVRRGFENTSGEIMAWLNSDDLLLPGSLMYVGSFFSQHPEVDVVYGHRVLIDRNDQEIGRWVLPRHDDEVLFWADYVPQETLFWRRSLWEKVGGIDVRFQFALDWDLLLRFVAEGAKMVRLPRFLGAFRVHGGQKTSSQIGDLGSGEMAILRERVHGREVTHEEIARGIRPYLRRHIAVHNLWRAGILRY